MGENLINEHGIFTPNKVLNQTAEEVYKNYLSSVNTPLPKESTTEETLLKEMASLKIEIMKLRGGHV